MSTVDRFATEFIRKSNPHMSALKATVETAFYGNNVREITNLAEAYEQAVKAPNTLVLDALVSHATELGLPEDAHILAITDGKVVGRTAKARRILGTNPKEDAILLPIAREAVYQASFKPFLKASAVVGLDEDFMVRAHITMPEREINNLYSWLLNFQIYNDTYKKRYLDSTKFNENDIYIFFDPTWSHPDYPDGLAFFDTTHNTAIILGMSYFGEIKKGTLTLAWATAARNNFVSCHGGLKIFRKEDKSYVASFFGLSGSGKSTLTHAKHDGKYDIKVLHDDAFVISVENGSSIALEPSYFDKTNDYPAGHREQEFFVTVQNCGITLDENGNRVLVTEDVRNGNGRTVKSRYATPNRVDKIEEPIQSIFWIMKDDSLPPLVKVNNANLASILGCTLMTKRSSAENTAANLDSLVIEPYANPFRVYPLVEDFDKFKALFDKGVDCYIINTGEYLGKKVTPAVSLGAIESVVDGTAKFTSFGDIDGFEYLVVDGHEVPELSGDYAKLIKERMAFRLNYLKEFNASHPEETIPETALEELEKVIAATDK
ncbi:phosphoenolpyruvate carboxykinase (ATP) [Tuanshanicoccus lijuaniae]|uniref:phosphoenolpyruvate carboxykinase (ATP) n=1 Tax=Aerococcaceae bacterium zg-1292 TaxID=2774330 RepID=UPI001938B08A|nr:phosphoenolpyruvate carboxykinase (ATP) [Aerococcaceae bacterium zg-1292]MBS4455682.1 phosphoenolpyruvate carboxykinase (ATP) [Aerococcaceae bacterium zg-A91]MBS4457433.1 phosphoenolpyruvate carboxykinase (ATP) [Aerococcaceae bacterium zg-BR33]QQA37117.1 phosphoenolpyruvate carboxykinase (ATP) [Aerococcaceae bacterium zg-1292]